MNASANVFPIESVAKTRSGKGAARELRRNGMVPAVVYGPGKEPAHYGINFRNLKKAMASGSFYSTAQVLRVDGKDVKVLAKAIQRDPVTDEPIHVDFLSYVASSQVHVNVPVNLIGEDNNAAIKGGAVLQLIETTLEIVCRADSIPEHIDVDVSSIGIGESVHLSSIALPKGTRSAVTDRDLTIASVIATRTSTMAAMDAEADAEQAPAEEKAAE